ncbi:hypothetical protein F5Y10DRAFT_82203 [Nemania abortiva]|nr:hypothetical protein F5Y10DRAFT_82203 [Nemania abortiva]
MIPTTPDKQKSYDAPAQADPTPEPHPQPQNQPAVHDIASPTSTKELKSDDASAPVDTSSESQPVLNLPTTDLATSQKPNSADGLDPFVIGDESPSEPSEWIIVDAVIEVLVEELTTTLRNITERCACQLGCSRSYNTRFTPTMSEIRVRLSPLPNATLQDIADETVTAILSAWVTECHYCITKYRKDMFRDVRLVAREESEAVKLEVLAVADAEMRLQVEKQLEKLVNEELVDEELVDEELVDEELVDEELVDEELVDEELVDEELMNDPPRNRFIPTAMTPETKGITQGVSGLKIQDESPTKRPSTPAPPTIQRPKIPIVRRVPNTTKGIPIPTAPTHLTIPDDCLGSAQHSIRTPIGSPHTPKTSPLKRSTQRGRQSPQKTAQRNARTPVRRDEPPPAFGLNLKK